MGKAPRGRLWIMLAYVPVVLDFLRLIKLTIGKSVETHVVEWRVQENRSNSHNTSRCSSGSCVSCRTDCQDDVNTEDTADTCQVHMTSLELEHSECHAGTIDERPTCHSEINQVLALSVCDADLVEDLLEIKGQRVVARPLGKDTDTKRKNSTTAITRGGKELAPGHLLALELDFDGSLNLGKLGCGEL